MMQPCAFRWCVHGWGQRGCVENRRTPPLLSSVGPLWIGWRGEFGGGFRVRAENNRTNGKPSGFCHCLLRRPVSATSPAHKWVRLAAKNIATTVSSTARSVLPTNRLTFLTFCVDKGIWIARIGTDRQVVSSLN